MDIMNPLFGKTVATKPLAGLAVILYVATIIGGWLYVDNVRNEIESKIDALEARIEAMKSEEKKVSPVAESVHDAGPLSYPTLPNGTKIEMQKLPAESSLMSRYEYSRSCGVTHPGGYVEAKLSKVSGRSGYSYEFTLDRLGYSKISSTYGILVLPNPGYVDLDSAAKDFEICDAGADVPIAIDSDWIAFADGCGGMSDDEGLPLGCEVLRRTIAGSISFK
jgi:hypothetical protein